MSPTEGADVDTTEGQVDPTQATADDADVTADDDTSDEDPFEAAVTASLELERERIRREVEEQNTTRAREAKRKADEDAEAARYSSSWADAVKEAREKFKGLRLVDDDERPYTPPDDLFESVVAQPFQKHNAVLEKGVTQQLLTALADNALATLPEDERERFAEVAAGKPLDQWLRLYGEAFAPHTEHAKFTAKEVEAKVKAAEARAVAKAQRSPTGTASQLADRGNPNGGNQPDQATHAGLARALALGIIDDVEYRSKRRKIEAQG